MKDKLVSLAKRGWVLPVICALVLSVTAGVVIAASFALNQPVGVTITVNPVTGGGSIGGGPGTPPGPTSANLYANVECTDILGSLSFVYAVGGTQDVTAYVKAAEIQSVTSPVTVDAGLSGTTLTAALGAVTGIARPVVITAAGGAAGTYTGTATFTGTGVTQ